MFMRSHSSLVFTSAFGLLTAFVAPVVAQTVDAAAPAPAPSTAASPAAALPPGSADPGVTAPLEPLAFETELEAFVRPGALTSDEVARRALTGSPRIAAKEAAVETAQAQADAVLGGFYPKLTGTARYTRLSDITLDPAVASIFTVILNQYALGASLTIPLSDYVLRLSTALSGASKNKDAAQLTARAERLAVQTDAKVAYYTWVKALGALYVANKGKEQIDSSLKDVERSFSLGTASKADVLRTESQMHNFELLQMRARQAVEVASANLRTVMHDTESKQYFVGEPILSEVVPPAMPTTEDGYVEAKRQRLELRSLQALEEAYHDQATLAKVDYLPRLDAQGNVTYANPNQRYFPAEAIFRGTWDASLTLSWTPTDIPRAMGTAATAESRAMETAAQRRQLEDGLRVEVAQALSEMRNTLEAVKTNREVLKSSEEGFRVRTELFKAGRATTLEVTEAQNSLTQARLDLVFAHVDTRIAKAKLLHVLGRDVPTEK